MNMDIEALRGLVDPELHDWLDDILRMCNAPYAIDNKIELVSVSKEAVRMRKEVTPRDLNSNGVVHGAVSFGLIDHAFAVIGNIDTQSVGLSCNIIYHRPCFGSMLEAEARLVNESRTLITVDVSLRSENRLIASASCIGFKGERPKR